MSGEFVMIEAAQSDRPRVMGLAYSGGKMSLPGWRHPVVVDLAGLELPRSVPLLTNHENRTGSRVGMVRARVEDGSLTIEGEITSTNGLASGIVEQEKAGADWQLSIGAEVKDAELVPTGRSRAVNGQPHEGPFHHVKSAVLREVSVVAVGADAATRMQVAAGFELTGFQGDRIMKDEKPDRVQGHGDGVKGKENAESRQAGIPAAASAAASGGERDDDETRVIAPPGDGLEARGLGREGTTLHAMHRKPQDPSLTPADAVRAERERVSDIQAICAGEFPQIEREAISAGWDPDRVRGAVLKAIRDSRPQADVGIMVAPESIPADTGAMLEAALCLRSGMSEDGLAAQYGERTVERARREQDVSLQQLFVECARLEGMSVPRSFGNDTIRAAFSTAALPGILNNVANKRLLKSFQSQPIVATKLCSEGELTDFKESERYRLTDVGDLEPVAPDGEIKHGGLREEKAVNRLETFGKVFALTRQMIFNDDLGAFLKVPDGMGARAARKIDRLFFTRLLSNPNALFSAGHKNYKAGIDTALSADSLAAAIQMFLDQVDADGQPINVSPKFLLVPTALKITAREILNSITFFATGTNNKTRIPTYNALADEDLAVIASPYLSNSNYPGASAKAWYLFADPGVVDTFEIGYLRGKRTPTVERGETDFDTLGIKFRVFFDLGVREQDWRGVSKFKGEA